MCCDSECDADCVEANDWGKRFLVVYAFSLGESFGAKACFVADDIAMEIAFAI